MWFYPTKQLHQAWTMEKLDQRVQAADELGFDVVLRHSEDGLEVWYRKRADKLGYPFNI